MNEPIHIISLGAGVQSSTMALMAAKGEITPMPKCAIFADTGWEPRAVYEWLGWLEKQLPFEVYTVSHGNIRSENINARGRGRKENGERWASLPYFVKVEGQQQEGRIARQCTSEYKIQPIEDFIKYQLLRHEKGKRLPKTPAVIQWRGITTDEAARMKDSRVKWMSVRYPLAMECRMSRRDCLIWINRNGYPEPPRSACIGCPFHSNSEWLDMYENRPDEWKDAVEFDRAIRKAGGMRGDSFLHRSLKPLDEVDLLPKGEHGQINMFNNECEGMCGV